MEPKTRGFGNWEDELFFSDFHILAMTSVPLLLETSSESTNNQAFSEANDMATKIEGIFQ